MIQLLKELWDRITNFFVPEDYFSWQTMAYLGIFSFAMSWVARFSQASNLTEGSIATAGWIFFAIGIAWFLEKNKVRPLGIPIAPWVAGAIVCVYFFGLVSWGTWPMALIVWPLVSILIVAVPEFLTWEFKPKLPPPMVRQRLILLLLMALLFSSWFQFYFRLQSWFENYPSLAADDFTNSGFVHRMAGQSIESAKGISVLTAAETTVKETLSDTPWPYVERWLLNLGEQLERLRREAAIPLEGSPERSLWQLEARPRSVNDGYALDLIAFWRGPASHPEGYYFEKTCLIQPRPRSQATGTDDGQAAATPLAEVTCDLATPKRLGRPYLIKQG